MFLYAFIVFLYSFWLLNAAKRFKMSLYMNHYAGKTNFIEIMDSESDMRGIQQIINRYIDMQTYLYYE